MREGIIRDIRGWEGILGDECDKMKGGGQGRLRQEHIGTRRKDGRDRDEEGREERTSAAVDGCEWGQGRTVGLFGTP